MARRRRSSFLTDLRRANRDMRTLAAIADSLKPRGRSTLVAFCLLICFFPLGLHNFYAGRKLLGFLEFVCFACSFTFLTYHQILAARWFAGFYFAMLVWDFFTLDTAIERYNLRHPPKD